jgi:glucosamine-6-phosphate deaminase
MRNTPVSVFPAPENIGNHLGGRLYTAIETARVAESRFLLGCPTGRSPRPVYAALARQLTRTPQDLSHVVLVMMDDYLVATDGGFAFVPATELWSSRNFARLEIADRLNEGLPPRYRLRGDSIWLPDPRDPAAYDSMIADAGGIDFFMLASGASDGHVAFNPPGSPRESRSRIIELSAETRRDNLQTFPAFGNLDAVPTHGVSVGIDTIASAREAVMIVWGSGKRLTLKRIADADRYDPAWPATVIHECASGEILCDTEAAGSGAS